MDGSGVDLIGRHDLQTIVNGNFAEDRNGKANSAIHFSYGYALAPPDVYFDPVTGGFTIMAWIKMSSLELWQRFIDFGSSVNSHMNDHVFFVLGLNNKMTFILSNNGVETFRAESYVISTGTWFHFTISLSNTMSKVTYYLDGTNEISSALPG